MMAKLGMDDEAIRSLAGQLDGQARVILSLVGQIEGVVSRMHSAWKGHDSDAFLGWWQKEHKPALQRAHDSIAGLAQSARNNASAQHAVSGVDTGGTPLTAHASPPAPGPAPAPGQSPAAPEASAVGAARVAAFAAAHPQGTKAGDGQCVAVFTAYNKEIVGAPFIGVGEEGGAREFYERYDTLPGMSANYDRIPVGSPPQAGDVVVWGATSTNQYGHIAVCTGSTATSFRVIEQNAPSAGDPVRDNTYSSTSNVLGYLRPKHYR